MRILGQANVYFAGDLQISKKDYDKHEIKIVKRNVSLHCCEIMQQLVHVIVHFTAYKYIISSFLS